MAKMTSAQSQAWDCLKPIEQQSLFLQLSEGKSSWEAGNVLGITHYKYIEIRERSQKFFKLFTDFFEEHGSIFRPDSPCEPQFRDFMEACIEKRMKYKIKYKDLINRLKPFVNDEVVMVASNGEVSFFDKEGMVRIIHLVEYESKKEGARVAEL